MTLIAALLLATLLGPERPLAPVAFGPAYGGQYPQALVSNGTDFLAIWTGAHGVYAAAVDERGATRPTPPRALFTGNFVQAAWAGDAYVLAWYEGERLWFARMNRDAQLVSVPLAVADGAAPVAIASNGSVTMLLVTRQSGLTAMLLGSDGNVIRDGIALPATHLPWAATVIAAGGGFVVATVETTHAPAPSHAASTSARATRFAADGTLEHSVVLLQGLPHNVNTIDAATDGDRVGIAFVAQRNTNNGPQRLHAFTADARTLAVTAHAPRTVTGFEAEVVATPDGFAAGVLEFRENAPLTLLTIPFASDDRHVTQLVSNVPAADLRMATNGRTVLSVWRDYRFSPPFELSTMNLFGLALDATASSAATGVLPVAISAVAQRHPAIASAGATSLVAWMDLAKTVQGNVVAARVNARGTVLDRFTLATDVEAFQRPVVAFTGEVWIVAWYTMTAADRAPRGWMRRIARDGAVLDATPVDLGPGRAVSAASNGTVTLLSFGPRLLRLSTSGELLGTVTLNGAYQGSLASNGREFLLAWDEGSDWWQFPSPNLRDVRAIRLDANGTPIDVAPIDIAMSAANEVAPVATSDGTDFLVVYGHDARNGSGMTVRAKRVLRAGALADHTPLEEGSLVGAHGLAFAVAPHESGYMAVYARTTGAIEAVALDTRGTPAEEPVTLATAAGSSLSVSVNGGLIAYSRANPALGNIERVFVRAIAEGSPRRRTIRR